MFVVLVCRELLRGRNLERRVSSFEFRDVLGVNAMDHEQ